MKRTVVFAILALMTFAANANLQLGSLVACSGSLSVFSSTTDASSIECTGDLSFTGSSVQSNTSFSILATNNLSFLDVLVSAPELNFKAGGVLSLDKYSVLTAPIISLGASSLVLNGTITAPVKYSVPVLTAPIISLEASSLVLNGTIAAAVPEPSEAILLALGMTAIAARRRGKILAPLKKYIPSI